MMKDGVRPHAPSQLRRRVCRGGEVYVLTRVRVCTLPASIFAYGMTSSGKTYTMKGVTELAVGDIFSRIHKVGHVPIQRPC